MRVRSRVAVCPIMLHTDPVADPLPPALPRLTLEQVCPVTSEEAAGAVLL
jgi:hypothetical protein